MNTMARVLISGAGIAGPALAHWLLQRETEVTLVERAPRFRDSGYMIDVWGLGYELVERMGLLDAARARAYAIERLVVVDEDGREVSGFDANVFRDAFGGKFFSIPRGDLARIIFDRIEHHVEVLYSTSVTTLAENAVGVDAELSNGRKGRWDLVVGADGIHSRVRELALGPAERFERYLGYCAAAFSTDHYPHRDEGAYVTYARPGRQISRYSLGEHRTAFLIVVAQEPPPSLSGHDVLAYRRLLSDRFAADGWECPEILARLEHADDLYFDTVTQVRMPTWSRGRVVLVGDAAYCPSLLAGAGAAYAMLGAYVLAGELRDLGRGHRGALESYERRLRLFMDSQQRSAARFARSFAPRTRFGLHLRNLVLRFMRLKPLGAWYARRMFDARVEVPSYS
jgi:2-polyprenyl-6-methoxyphenol hydroxylase-like FAD-dependent oxidoreductase